MSDENVRPEDVPEGEVSNEEDAKQRPVPSGPTQTSSGSTQPVRERDDENDDDDDDDYYGEKQDA